MRKHILNKALKILLLTDGLIRLAGAMLAPIYALFVHEIGGDILDAGLAGAVFALAAGVTVLLSGKVSDEVHECKNIVVIGYCVMGIAFFCLLFVDSIWGLFAVQVMTGLGEALYVPAYDALYSRHLEAHKEAEEWGAWESMSYFTTALGAVVGGFIAQVYGFDPIFVLMAMLSIVSAWFLYRFPTRL